MSLRRIALAIVVSISMLGASAPAARFSLDAVLSAPFVDNMAASSDGTTIAYVAHERGLRNVYVSRGGVTKRLTSFDTDDGQEIGALAFSRDGGAIVYVRGGGYNREGAVANPRSLPVPPDRVIWVADTRGGAPLEAGVGTAPYLSPDGSRLIYVAQRGRLMSEDLAWDGTTLKSLGKPVELLSIRGGIRDERFSPDGSKIAFSNGRGDHGFIVIYDIAAKTYVYATPAFTQDYAPAWSPDGKRVAFLRLPGDREESDPYVDVREAPWEIWVADAGTGNAQRIFRAATGRGQEFYNTDSNDQLFWLADGTIVFPSERSGWRQLWAVPAGGGTARPLMHGNFEVENAVESVDGSRVLYATNEGDIDRRHIWSVGSTGSPQQLTSGTSDQWSPVALAGGGFGYVDAGWKTIPTVMSRTGGTTVSLGPTSGSYPSSDVVRPQLVTFRATDGLLLHGQVFVPNDGKAKHCGVVFTHGGSERQMLPGFHYMEAYANLYETNQYIANRGCVVLSINYRGGIMYGHDFREAKKKGERGGSEFLDLMGGTRYLLARKDVDPKRVGLYGLSYGGYITALGLARRSDIFKVGFDMAGVHNWATIMDGDYGQHVGTPAERKIAYDASPVAAIGRWTSPVYLAQGDDDRNVPFSQGEDLALRLRAKGVEVRTAVFPNETHEMTLTYRDSMRMFGGGLGFLLSHLGATP